MSTNRSARDIERSLAEADELVQRINAEFLNEMEEAHRLEFEIHARNLERIKSDVQDGIDKKKVSESNSYAEGMHEAILDIVKAMRGLTEFFS